MLRRGSARLTGATRKSLSNQLLSEPEELGQPVPLCLNADQPLDELAARKPVIIVHPFPRRVHFVNGANVTRD